MTHVPENSKKNTYAGLRWSRVDLLLLLLVVGPRKAQGRHKAFGLRRPSALKFSSAPLCGGGRGGFNSQQHDDPIVSLVSFVVRAKPDT